MSFEDESRPTLKELVTETLQANGTLEKIQAQLRASVFLSLEEECQEKNIPLVNKRTQQLLSSPNGKLALGLVKDFLECLELDLTLTVLTPESQMKSIGNIPDHSTLESTLETKSEAKETDPKFPVLLKLISKSQISSSKTFQNGTLEKSKQLVTNPIENLQFEKESGNFDSTPSIIDKLKECASETSSRDDAEKPAIEEDKVLDSSDIYDDQFPSSTETESTTKDDASQKDTEADEPEIEEDLSLNGVLSTQSDVSENTRDITISDSVQPIKLDFQESL